MAKRKLSSVKRVRRSGSKAGDWRTALYRKQYEMVAWDWKEDPTPHIRNLCRFFRLRPSLRHLEPEYPERLLQTIASTHNLHVYDVPSLEGSDVYGFILSREPLSRREIQQVEADFWGEDFDEVYEP